MIHDLASMRRFNLEDLTMRYHDQGKAASAVQLMKNARGKWGQLRLYNLLRHHGERSVWNEREINQRDSVDFLIAFYSLLEIASLVGFIPEGLPRNSKTEFLAELSFPPLLRYYEHNYPLLLPRLFRLRMEKKWSNYEKDPSESTHLLFQAFLSLESRVRTDDDIDMFLWFLDDGRSGGYVLADVMKCLKKQSRFMKRILHAEEEFDDLDSALRGFGKLLALWVDLDQLLQRCSPWPMFQSAIWHYYAYWFDLVSESIGKHLRSAIENVLSWTSDQSPETSHSMHVYIAHVSECIDRLLSPPYGTTLRRAAERQL